MIRYPIRWELLLLLLLLLLEMIGESVVCTVWIVSDHRHHPSSTTTGGHVQHITLKSFRRKQPRLRLDATSSWRRRWYLGATSGRSQCFRTRIQQPGVGNIVRDCTLSATSVGEATTTKRPFCRTVWRSRILFLYSFE
uniref:Secreted peptide n=1 Tax=Anopheles braziliensis TaxID=58242 RepID=A0A2M3ZLZ0_9DIPT